MTRIVPRLTHTYARADRDDGVLIELRPLGEEHFLDFRLANERGDGAVEIFHELAAGMIDGKTVRTSGTHRMQFAANHMRTDLKEVNHANWISKDHATASNGWLLEIGAQAGSAGVPFWCACSEGVPKSDRGQTPKQTWGQTAV